MGDTFRLSGAIFSDSPLMSVLISFVTVGISEVQCLGPKIIKVRFSFSFCPTTARISELFRKCPTLVRYWSILLNLWNFLISFYFASWKQECEEAQKAEEEEQVWTEVGLRSTMWNHSSSFWRSVYIQAVFSLVNIL